jgi:two-component system response regulator NreC
MNQPIRILLVDDHAVLRAGLKVLLNAEPDMAVVGEAGDGQSCLELAGALQPDVILLDLNMPGLGGLEVLAELSQRAPASRALVLTMHDDAVYLRQVLARGGAGYVLKQAADSELLTAIRTVYHGGIFLHPAHTQAETPQTPGDGLLESLSDREREVLRLLALGHSNKEIAQMLFLSVKTVETYKARLMEKLDLKTRAALVRFALQHGLLDENET